MKNFTTFSFIISMLSMASFNAAIPEEDGVAPGSLDIKKLTDIFGIEKKEATGEKDKIKKQDTEEEPNATEDNASETIKAAGDYDDEYESDTGYGHRGQHGRSYGRRHGRRYGRRNDLYRRAEAELNSKHGKHSHRVRKGHRRHADGYGFNDSDCSDSDNGYGHHVYYGRRNGLYRRAEEAEEAQVKNKHGRHGRFGDKHHRKHGRGYGTDDSDDSDSDKGYSHNVFYGKHPKLYRRAEESEVGNGQATNRHFSGRRHGRYERGYRSNNSDFSDSDDGYVRRGYHGQRHGLYRRAEEAEESRVNGKDGKHGHNRRHHGRGYGQNDSDCSDDDSGYSLRSNRRPRVRY